MTDLLVMITDPSGRDNLDGEMATVQSHYIAGGRIWVRLVPWLEPISVWGLTELTLRADCVEVLMGGVAA